MKQPNLFLKATLLKPSPSKTGFSKARTEVRICFSDGNSTADGRVIEPSAIETLMESLPGTPIVGIYDSERKDFRGHFGTLPKQRFGFIPEDCEGNIVEDDNGQEWLVAEAVIWTNYEGADAIFGANQSLEIDENNYEGSWKEDANGNPYYAFTKASFKALCVLGRDVQPAYTGAGFGDQQDFATQNSRKEEPMENTFKLSIDEQVGKVLQAAELSNVIPVEVFDDAVVVYDCDSNDFKRVPYTKELDETTNTETITVGEIETVKYYAISVKEEQTIDALRAEYELKKGEWEVVESELKEQLSAHAEKFESQTKELEAATQELAELKTSMEAQAYELNDKESALNSLSAEFEKLATQYKSQMLSKYAGVFEEAEIETLQATPMVDFKSALGELLINKEVGVAKVADFAAIANAPKPTDNCPEWAKAVKERTN